MSIELTKRGKIVAVGLATIGIALLWAFASSSMVKLPPGFQPGATVGYYTIDAQYGDHLINTVPDLLVVDANTDSTNYLAGKFVTKAVWSLDPLMYKDSKRPIMVYSTPDSYADTYCRGLMGKVFGPVYLMKGGYDDWNAWVHRNG